MAKNEAKIDVKVGRVADTSAGPDFDKNERVPAPSHGLRPDVVDNSGLRIPGGRVPTQEEVYAAVVEDEMSRKPDGLDRDKGLDKLIPK